MLVPCNEDWWLGRSMISFGLCQQEGGMHSKSLAVEGDHPLFR